MTTTLIAAPLTSGQTAAPDESRYTRTQLPDLARDFPVNVVPLLFGGGQDWRPTRAQVESFRTYATIGDPLADALVAAMKGPDSKQLRQQFEQALEHGIDSV